MQLECSVDIDKLESDIARFSTLNRNKEAVRNEWKFHGTKTREDWHSAINFLGQVEIPLYEALVELAWQIYRGATKTSIQQALDNCEEWREKLPKFTGEGHSPYWEVIGVIKRIKDYGLFDPPTTYHEWVSIVSKDKEVMNAVPKRVRDMILTKNIPKITDWQSMRSEIGAHYKEIRDSWDYMQAYTSLNNLPDPFLPRPLVYYTLSGLRPGSEPVAFVAHEKYKPSLPIYPIRPTKVEETDTHFVQESGTIVKNPKVTITSTKAEEEPVVVANKNTETTGTGGTNTEKITRTAPGVSVMEEVVKEKDKPVEVKNMVDSKKSIISTIINFVFSIFKRN